MCGTKALSQLGNEASLVNEVFYVVFQMVVEAKGEGSGVTLHTGIVPVSELIAAFKSHMLIQIQTPNSSKLYISECGLKTEACTLSASLSFWFPCPWQPAFFQALKTNGSKA